MGISPKSDATPEKTEAVPDPDFERANSSPRPGQELLQERLHMGETSFALEVPRTAAEAATPKPGAELCHDVNVQRSWSYGKPCDHALLQAVLRQRRSHKANGTMQSTTL